MNLHPFKSKIDLLLESRDNVLTNLQREKKIRHVIDNEEAIVSRQGALATWTSRESTGRSPKDTVWKKLGITQRSHLISYYFCNRFGQLFANYAV